MLYIIGIGLNDQKDITVKGLEAVRECNKVYLENYTSIVQCSQEELEESYGLKMKLAGRAFVEDGKHILEAAKKENVALLVVGDVFTATTHFDLYKRAREQKIDVEVIHNTSIFNAVSITGLQLYKFGKVTSIPFDNKNVKAPYDVLLSNKRQGLHTLFMLDIKIPEKKFMTANQAIDYLLDQGLDKETLCVACARLGNEKFAVKSGTAKKLRKKKFGKPPHCLIIPGNLHFQEEEAMEMWK